jgi:tRNA-dihydrouridine synthase A
LIGNEKAGKINKMIFATAPMMDWTDTWCRRFHRALTRRALLFTEMVVDHAVIRGDRERLLAFEPVERPLALQLGGSEPGRLAEAAVIGADWGYDEINLNVGCPSDRVQDGRFGACLMREPDLVGRAVEAMSRAVATPVTVKCRIGVDDQEPREALFTLARACAAAGAGRLYVHARKAWLQGLSPKDNRDVPPLEYDVVRALKVELPGLEIVLNGGLKDLLAAEREGRGLDGVMLGRAAYQDTWILAAVDPAVYGAPAPVSSRREAAEALMAIIDDAVARGRSAHAVARHALGLFHGEKGARAWRRVLSEEARGPGAGSEIVARALERLGDGAETRAACS